MNRTTAFIRAWQLLLGGKTGKAGDPPSLPGSSQQAPLNKNSLPLDFEPALYRSLQADLGNLTDSEAAAHYLEHGRREGRRFRVDQPDGIDPEHFRETHPGYAFTSDRDCELAWLNLGGEHVEPGTRANHLARLQLDVPDFPVAFPWRYYARTYPRESLHRWAALAHFISDGFAQIGSELPYGAQGHEFLVALGARYAKLESPLAIKAYELAKTKGILPAEHQSALAQAYAKQGYWRLAYEEYRQLAERGDRRPATLDALIGSAGRSGYLEPVLQLLESLPGIGAALGGKLAADAAEQLFTRASALARAHYAEGRHDEGHAEIGLAASSVDRISRTFAPRGQRTRLAKRNQILLFAEAGLPNEDRSRLDQQHAAFEKLGYAVARFGIGDTDRFERALPHAAAAIFYRVPAWPSVLLALLMANRSRVATFYETSNLSFDLQDGAAPYECFDRLIGCGAHQDLIFGTALYGATAVRCQYGIAPNAALAARLAEVVSLGRAVVLRDRRPHGPLGTRVIGDGNIRLFLRADQAFVLRSEEAAGAALIAALERYSHLYLATAGYVQLGDEFARFADRIHQTGPASDVAGTLSASDLNVVVAGRAPADDVTPETNWLEAARHGVPTLASSTRAYREALSDGYDVVLAEDDTTWRTGLDNLIENAGRRDALTAAAKETFAARYAVGTSSNDDWEELSCLLRPTFRLRGWA